jgi:hypothetical protein
VKLLYRTCNEMYIPALRLNGQGMLVYAEKKRA